MQRPPVVTQDEEVYPSDGGQNTRATQSRRFLFTMTSVKGRTIKAMRAATAAPSSPMYIVWRTVPGRFGELQVEGFIEFYTTKRANILKSLFQTESIYVNLVGHKSSYDCMKYIKRGNAPWEEYGPVPYDGESQDVIGF